MYSEMGLYSKSNLAECGNMKYILSGKLPKKYSDRDVLSLAGLNNHYHNNTIYPLKNGHGFKSEHPDYVVIFLEHFFCNERKQFVDVVSIEKLNDLSMYFTDKSECIHVCFVGYNSHLYDSTGCIH